MGCSDVLSIYKSCAVFLTLLLVSCTSGSTSMPKLILISMDGFRYDYLDLIPPNETEHFQYMIRNGVKAKAIMNVFPTVTYPNHFTLITGLYPESHGIIHNRFYDTYWEEYFMYSNKRDNVDPFWYDGGAEPIYVTNKKAGGFSGSVVWPTGIGEVKGIKPDRLVPDADAFTEINNTKRVETLIKWFTEKTNPINLGLLYFNEPDEIAHATGAGSKNVTDYIKTELNSAVGYLLRRLKEVDLLDEMNIILTADHGFANLTKDKAIVLSEHLNSSWYKTGAKDFGHNGNHMTVNIFPEEGQKENVLKALKSFPSLKVYQKGEKELVDLHYSTNERIAPIVITGSEEGIAIFPDEASRDNYRDIGVHGYNPLLVPNMRPFFIAMGPAFKKGYVSQQFNSVDIYPLMCHILGIEPAPNNGSLENVIGLLLAKDKPVTDKLTITGISFLIIVGTSVTLAGIYAICACNNARKKHRLLLPGNQKGSGVTSVRSTTDHLLNSEDDDDEF